MPVLIRRNKLSLRSPTVSGIQTLTPAGTANTKGSYTQMLASTSADCRMLRIELFANPSAANTKSFLVDIATGAAASEAVLVPNLGVQATIQFGLARSVFFIPCRIPAGTRIAARCQCNTGTSPENMFAQVTVYDGDVRQLGGGGGVDAIGADTATSRGTAITPGNSSVKSSYVQLTASTSNRYVGLFGVIDMGSPTGGNFNQLLTDVAIGAAASEVIIIPDWWSQSWDSYIREPSIHYHPINIPAGTRISARMSEGGTATGKGIIVYGVKP